ncbi:MAG TPA: ABC transporter permease, partial [Lacipirellulaceae bacterium]
WWVAAIATPFLELHVTPRSLLVGWVIGVAISWLTILWSTRRLARQPANRLLAGAITTEAEAGAAGRGHGAGRRSALPPWAIARAALALLTITLLALSTRVEGEAQAGVFFATGAMVLVLMLGEIRHRLRWKRARAARQRTFALPALSALNTARNPGRSTLTIGLVAAASFLIVAISAFRLETDDAGTGGFDFLATSDLAVNFDLNTKQGRLKLGFSDADNEALNTCRVYSLRVADGEDASCLNLYRPTQPRVLGVPNEFIERGGFAWSATQNSASPADGATKHSSHNPWALLNADLGRAEAGGPIVPVVLDASTAVYSLHLGGVGDRLTIRDAAGAPVTLEVVGLLKNSVLQGNLLVSEQSFLQMFPGTGGNRFFLIENRAGEAPAEPRPATNIGSAGASPSQEIAQILESTLAEEGFDVVDAREQLGQFLAVQNTYLSTFQSLGALGLLLGTVGLAIVQLRSVIERRAELALMRAAGFRSSRLTGMIIWENGVLLFGGLLTGSVAAAVTLLPQSMLHEAGVPWRTLGALLVIIAVVGLLAAWLATRSALRAPILPALRGD